MPLKLRNLIWIISLISCYPLYACGQLYLFISKQKEAEFYDLIKKHPNDWINAHVLLMLGVVLLIPTFIAFCYYFKNSRAYFLVQLSTVFTFISSFVLFGQFTIDLCLIGVFKMPKETAYEVLNAIQNDPLVKPLFYDNSQIFFLLKYADFTFLAQILLGIAFILSTKIPKWAIILFFIALLLTQFGILIDPFYGRIIKRFSYALFSVSFLPIAAALRKLN
ncbi:hypothetical protein IC229_11875 [Spirosoma sp. BT702]|uniref:DUF4386 domain-containing protein n=1 Tax=Spirosoma profusum TaxID=2771354 RepID=A0A927ASI8_9BACT|nr:hypothetical protein [Spirosoma profusum]MBD2701340.1 hypothetical protein [Spirosoma profusum]